MATNIPSDSFYNSASHFPNDVEPLYCVPLNNLPLTRVPCSRVPIGSLSTRSNPRQTCTSERVYL